MGQSNRESLAGRESVTGPENGTVPQDPPRRDPIRLEPLERDTRPQEPVSRDRDPTDAGYYRRRPYTRRDYDFQDPEEDRGFDPLGGDDPYGSNTLFQEYHGAFMQDWFGFRPEVTATYGFRPDTEIQSEAGTFQENDFELNGRYAFPVGPDTFLQLGMRYRARVLQYSGNLQGSDEDETLQELAWQFGAGQFINDDLMIYGEFSPGLYTDFEGTLNSRDWHFFAKGLAVYRLDENLYVQGGLFANQVFEETPVYPVAGLIWLFAPRWRFDALLPEHVELQYNPIDRLFLTGFFRLQGQQYNRRATAANGGLEQFTRTQDARVGIEAQWRFTDLLSAQFSAGSTIFGNWEIRGPAGESNGQILPEGFFFLGMGLDF
jgi:hypothetical protein